MHAGMYVCMNMLTGETSFVKPESLYAYYNAMLIQRINFLDMYVCMYVWMHACMHAHKHTHTHTHTHTHPILASIFREFLTYK